MPLRNRRLEMGNKPVKGVADAVDAKDAVNKSQMDTAISTAVGAIDLSGYVTTARTITAGVALSGGGDLSANRTIDLEDTAVTPGSYTNTSLTVDQQGRITAASSGAPPATYLFKTADQSRTSSTAWTDVDDLSFSVDANTAYFFSFFGVLTFGAGGFNIGVNGPTLTSLYWGEENSTPAAAYDTAGPSIPSGTSRLVVAYGFIKCSASGTVAIRFRQNSSSGAATTMKAGSVLMWKSA